MKILIYIAFVLFGANVSFCQNFINDKDEVNSFLFSNQKADIYKQLTIKKDRVSIAIIGSVGRSIGEMVAGSTSLRILYSKLKEKELLLVKNFYVNIKNK